MRITVISDTHTRHGLIPKEDLPGGDILICAGDIMNTGYNIQEIKDGSVNIQCRSKESCPFEFMRTCFAVNCLFEKTKPICERSI